MIATKQSLSPKEKARIIAEYLPLVKKIAKNLARRSSDPVEDLTQVGTIGLLEAASRYQQNRNTTFKTYAVHFITGHIRHYLRDNQTLLRGPRALQELSYRLNLITSRLSQQVGRDPTNFEVAMALGLPIERIDEIKTFDRRITILWLDQEMADTGDDEVRTLMDTISDSQAGREGADELDRRILLAEALNRLQPNQRELLEMRYFQDMTQAEISQRFAISQMEVCRRLKRAEKQLKAMLEQNN